MSDYVNASVQKINLKKGDFITYNNPTAEQEFAIVTYAGSNRTISIISTSGNTLLQREDFSKYRVKKIKASDLITEITLLIRNVQDLKSKIGKMRGNLRRIAEE